MTEVEHLFGLGILAPWYLRDDQLPIYDLLLKSKRPFIECARRYGKTTTILCYVIEKLIQNPGWVCLWCEPDKNQAREIVKPEMTKLFNMAPEAMRPQWSSEDSYYWFPSTGNRDTASRLKLRGVNHDKGDSARGPAAHIIVADEYGFWTDPKYTVKEALAPQLQTTQGPLIKASTPPEELGHPYYDEKSEAISAGRFIQRIIHDNKSLSETQHAQIIADCGGTHTPAYQREYLCKPVADPESLVIPEYNEEIHDIEAVKRPDFYDSYVGMDLGLNDNTAALFAHVDFVARTLVIEGEYVANGKNTKEITDGCKGMEQVLWGGKPYARWGDNELQQLYDMETLHGYYVQPTRKDDKLSAINELRLLFSQGRIKISKNCQALRYQLKVGIWNPRRTDFKRGEKTGHLDAVDALIYLSRNINWTHNPYPQNVGVSIYTNFIPESTTSQGHQDEQAFASALDPLQG